MKALTLIQPWATLVVHGPKRIENRTWAPPRSVVGARILIHAGRAWDRDAADRLTGLGFGGLVEAARASRGAILGSVVVTGYVEGSDDPWFCGPFGWTLADVVRYGLPVPAKGSLGLWSPSAEILKACTEQEG